MVEKSANSIFKAQLKY